MSAATNGNHKLYFLISITVLLCISSPAQVLAQAAESTLWGKITSATGSSIPNAHLSLKNTANGPARTATANQDGTFALQNLLPGTYEITASAPGCGSLVNSGNPNHYIKTQCFAAPNPITLRGNLGRNTLIGPGLMNLDSSLLKNNRIKRISDTFNVQFRAEFFNLLNRANFAPPLDNRNIFDSTGNPIGNAGLITSTQTPSRQIQFALKLIW